MEVSGEYTLYASRERVWEALLDPEMLRRTVPGCERLEREDENLYRVRMGVNVAAVKGVYDGTLRLSDVQRPDHYAIVVEGSGARGVLRGEGTVRLEARDAATTVLHYAGRAQLGGTIASVGSRMAQGAADLLLKQYFARLADTLEAEDQQPAGGPPPAEQPQLAVASTGATDAHAAIPTHPVADARRALSRESAAGNESNATSNGVTAAMAAIPHVRRGPLMRLVRRSGLSDGTIESERRISRLLAGSTAGVIALAAMGVALAVAERRRAT
jgi:carbon monoxide dehydrogenase subunit G